MLARCYPNGPCKRTCGFCGDFWGRGDVAHGLARLALPAVSDGRLVHHDGAPTCESASENASDSRPPGADRLPLASRATTASSGASPSIISNSADAPTVPATRRLTSTPAHRHHLPNPPEFPEITRQSFRNVQCPRHHRAALVVAACATSRGHAHHPWNWTARDLVAGGALGKHRRRR